MALTPSLRASKRVVFTPPRLSIDSLAMFAGGRHILNALPKSVAIQQSQSQAAPMPAIYRKKYASCCTD